jgi:hypothetical protein
MTRRDLRTILLTVVGVALLLAAYGAYLIVKGPEVSSGGGTASQYAEQSR